MIEPIKPNDSDADALFQLARRPGQIKEVHLFPVPNTTQQRAVSRQVSLPVLPTSRPDRPLPDSPA
jgi:hypothetical protein